MELHLTDAAREKIAAALEGQPGKSAIRVEAGADGGAEFKYSMKLITSEEITVEDLQIEAGGVTVVVDPRSSGNLKGATIDYEDRIVRSGFRFDNPNKPEIPAIGQGPRSDLSGSLGDQVQRLLDTELNPAVAAHGGMISLVGVKKKDVYLSFGGGCHGCGMVDVTLKQGVEARIRELIPDVGAVIDVTDHSAGENPFYS